MSDMMEKIEGSAAPALLHGIMLAIGVGVAAQEGVVTPRYASPRLMAFPASTFSSLRPTTPLTIFASPLILSLTFWPSLRSPLAAPPSSALSR